MKVDVEECTLIKNNYNMVENAALCLKIQESFILPEMELVKVFLSG